MRYGLCVPCLGEFADPRQVAELARRAEESGWDGFYVWDHVVFPFAALEVADPWVLLTMVAAATERVTFGPLVTPVARRRTGALARQTTSLDRLSGGRLVLGAGLGFTGRTPVGQPDAAAATVDAIAAAGATWWLEGFHPGPGQYEEALRRVTAGPPRADSAPGGDARKKE
ncbi:LLM class flavin-dependent oxidoreductase [Nocardia asiatica]|uniref:LLM class flavin-dependent oxidoreductase n=1 Tax=Nocardia asiatica TaxID=209252 RepID=UPI003EDFA23F